MHRQTDKVRRWTQREGRSLGRALLNGAERERYPSHAMDRSSLARRRRERERERKVEAEREGEKRCSSRRSLRRKASGRRADPRESVDHGEKRRDNIGHASRAMYVCTYEPCRGT